MLSVTAEHRWIAGAQAVEMNLDERVRKTPIPPAPVDVAGIIKRSRRRYAVWWATMPTAVFVAAFTVLCLEECTAMPWLTFLIAPVASVALGILSAVIYWMKSSSLPSESRRDTRRFILTSILWGPFLGLAVFYALITVMSVGGVVIGAFN
jgi:hypothetical protein